MIFSSRTPGAIKRARSLVLSSVCVSGLLTGQMGWLEPVSAASAGHQKKHHVTSDASVLGIDSKALAAIDSGNWADAVKQLEQDTNQVTAADSNCTWLAFGYLFQGKATELEQLASKCGVGTGKDSKLLEPTAEPANINAVLVQAYALVSQNKLKEANALLDQLSPKFDADAAVDFTRAAIAGKMGSADKAAQWCDKTVAAAPNFAWAYRTLGYLCVRFLKDNQRAANAYAHAVEISPDFQEALDSLIDIRLTQNNFDGAIDLAQNAIKQNPKKAINYYRLSQIYVKQWRLREASAQMQEAIKLDPSEARFYRSRAAIARFQGDLPAAIAEQERAVEYSHDKAFELGELATLNMLANRPDAAIKNLNEAIKLNPDNQNLRDQLVKMLTDAKRYDDLAAALKPVVASKPNDAGLHLALGQALLNAGKKEEAIDQLKEAANLDNTNPEAHRIMGALHIKERDFESAAKEYLRALNINPSSVPDLVALGFCKAQTDDYMQAEAAFVTALALQQLTQANTPQMQASRLDIMRSLAGLLLTEGRYADAATQYENINALSKGTEKSKLDDFLLLQAKALRDLDNASAKRLLESYKALPDDDRKANLIGVVDSLLEAKHADMALGLVPDGVSIEETKDGDERRATAQLMIEKASALRVKGDAKASQSLVSRVVSEKDMDASIISRAQLEVARDYFAEDASDKADETARQAIETYPKDYFAYVLLGKISLKKGANKEAIDSAKKALELNPYCAQAYMLMGDAQVASDNTKDALESYKKATELYPSMLEAHKNLLSVLQKLSKKEDAQREADAIANLEKRQ